MKRKKIKKIQQKFLKIKRQAKQGKHGNTPPPLVGGPQPPPPPPPPPPEGLIETTQTPVEVDPSDERTSKLCASLMDRRERFTGLEIELVEMRELINILQSSQTKNTEKQRKVPLSNHQESEERRDDLKREVSALRIEMKELQEERLSYQAQLAAMSEEIRELRHEKEQRKKNNPPLTSTTTSTIWDKSIRTN